MRRTRVEAGPALPSASWVYSLLVGDEPGVRLPGWPTLYREDPEAGQVWAQHREALCTLAEQHGFEPFFLHKRRPTGAGFQIWRGTFLAAHRY